MVKLVTEFSKILKQCIRFFLSAFPFFFSLIAYEILYLIIMPYHKGMITALLTECGGSLFGENIIRILYYVFYAIILCGVILYLDGRDFRFVERKKVIHIVVALMLLRCITDVINLVFIKFTSPIWQSYSNLITEVLFITVAVNFISTRFGIKIICSEIQILAFFLFFSVSGLRYFYLYLEYRNYTIKYAPKGCVYQAYINNLDFRLQLCQLVFMSLWLVMYVCMLFYAIRYKDASCEKKSKEERIRFMKTRRRSVQTVRVGLMIATMVLISIFKMIVYPINTLLLIPDLSSMTRKTGAYTENEYEVVMYRNSSTVSSLNDDNIPVYKIDFCSVYYDEHKLISFSAVPVDFSSAPKWLLKRYASVNPDYTGRGDISNDYLLEYYSSDVIIYYDENKPHAVMLKDICKEPENDTLIFAVEKLIENGCWDYFEYGYEYLLEYDTDFIIPIINRYADGEFTEQELVQNTHMRKQYMIDFARAAEDDIAKGADNIPDDVLAD